jgi:signal transduction histidine kinase
MENELDATEKPSRVLLVDDDEDEYVIIREMLSNKSSIPFEVSWARGYEKAGEMLSKNSYDVCLVDYRLDKKSGIELISDFKKKGIDVPFILLTGRGDLELDIAAMLMGAVDFLEKGEIKPSQIERSIRYAIKNNNIIKQLTKERERGEELAKKILDSLEKERELVARDLHDSIGTSLSAIHFALGREIDLIQQTKTPGLNLEGLNRINDMLVDIIDETRRISGNLRPSILDNLGVIPAISSYMRQMQKVYGNIRLVYHLNILEEEIPEKLKINLYRVVQEGIVNAAKHSKAKKVDLVISKDISSILLDITDDGTGFDVGDTLKNVSHSSSMGLEGIFERVQLSGGEIGLHSETGQGTRICIRFPVEQQLAPFSLPQELRST